MDEQKEEAKPEEKEEATSETATTPPKEAGSEKEQEIVTKANDAAKLAKEAEELKASNLEKEEKLMERKEALAKLGGGSPAGDGIAKTEETPAEYSKKVMENGL